ncbi:RHS repeat-associated core domain-containing protein [Agromyces sp. S2-1-8]|uniref:RHS repeat-associated core domain-containing protein n=1 Tax=Agromyces sp. S2-1-8 TaxID=2897180 RepID=UPI001E499263|nr:RHS repeat-associated core domain-containing protein [Agromyces sp. S2-1-8]MCD5347573.1 RHS repeat-associated core domain-containing protein [Agromyces sp. S2-1-8]
MTDHHDTPLAAVPNGGNPTLTAVRRLYTDPFGDTRGTSNASTVPGDIQFLGKNRDAGSGLTLLGARHYDETVGAFISVDPILDLTDPQQWNGYAYAGNSPLTYEDASGLLIQGTTDNSTYNPHKPGKGRDKETMNTNTSRDAGDLDGSDPIPTIGVAQPTTSAPPECGGSYWCKSADYTLTACFEYCVAMGAMAREDGVLLGSFEIGAGPRAELSFTAGTGYNRSAGLGVGASASAVAGVGYYGEFGVGLDSATSWGLPYPILVPEAGHGWEYGLGGGLSVMGGLIAELWRWK